ncbi:hypothetical protein OEIGOIKO_04873 [Streptomyces chrestomyceticus JCM 4735]|uniref:Uncharacterized protein n=1 Tax=Streptomyces chrestomyceticus JCM 4735 TaxID=1306181 RepID=A0A7U9Q0A7_9ACTN|nr:hypothetical protein OEIGOIKO_04873 [Streptomyces chrestomyceticus JCM 4735]
MGVTGRPGATVEGRPGERDEEPAPVPGCDVCASACRDREPARADGHLLTVLSCNGVIAGHPHGRGGRA